MLYKNLNIVNLTPHTINLMVNGEDIAFPSEGNLRVNNGAGKPIPNVQGLPLFGSDVPGNPSMELPAQKNDTIYIVSGVVGPILKEMGRTDVFVPGTGPADEAIRENGQIKAVTRFKRP